MFPLLYLDVCHSETGCGGREAALLGLFEGLTYENDDVKVKIKF